jgi:hypothetical protein
MRLVAAALVILMAGTAVAQHQHGQSPYAGMHQRAIKTLSEQQLADLRAGRGMGLALAAELNGYPGPLHVLELADRLQLSSDQTRRVQVLYTAMKGEAVAAGEKLIAAEQELDRQFADKEITSSRLASLTSRIGERQGELRAIHLKYHLTTADVLTPNQLQQYRELRGYR